MTELDLSIELVAHMGEVCRIVIRVPPRAPAVRVNEVKLK